MLSQLTRYSLRLLVFITTIYHVNMNRDVRRKVDCDDRCPAAADLRSSQRMLAFVSLSTEEIHIRYGGYELFNIIQEINLHL